MRGQVNTNNQYKGRAPYVFSFTGAQMKYIVTTLSDIMLEKIPVCRQRKIESYKSKLLLFWADCLVGTEWLFPDIYLFISSIENPTLLIIDNNFSGEIPRWFDHQINSPRSFTSTFVKSSGNLIWMLMLLIKLSNNRNYSFTINGCPDVFGYSR